MGFHRICGISVVGMVQPFAYVAVHYFVEYQKKRNTTNEKSDKYCHPSLAEPLLINEDIKPLGEFPLAVPLSVTLENCGIFPCTASLTIAVGRGSSIVTFLFITL